MSPRRSASEELAEWTRPAREWNSRHPPGTRVLYRGVATKTFGKAFLNTWRELRVRVEGSLDLPLVDELELLDQLALPLPPTESSGAKTRT